MLVELNIPWGAFILPFLVGVFLQIILLLVIRKLRVLKKDLRRPGFSNAAFWPLSLMVWLSMLALGLRASTLELPQLFKVLQLSFLFVVAWLLVRLATYTERGLVHRLDEQQGARTSVHLVVRVFQVLVLTTGVLFGLQILGYPTSTLLTLGGVGGLVLGIAFRDTLANFFAGLMLYLEAPFRVGDTVSVQGGAYLGEILNIGWRSTEVLTRERRHLHIPNNLLVTDMVENISSIDRRRIRETFGIRYQDLRVLPLLVEELQKMLCAHPGVDQQYSPLVVFDAFGPYSLDIMIDVLARTGEWTRYKQTRHDLFLKVAECVHAQGADFAFPTQSLHIAAQEGAANSSAADAAGN